ncbi:MAG: hypothetical protein PHO67_08255 [Candidatus Omnitrophica bacterium]|nr:hypothetical protein [Candidatus Omnitrophota bacterium]
MAKKKAKRKVGHPVTRWTPTARENLLDALLKYIDANDIPILTEFAFLNRVHRSQLYELEELSDAIKLCIEKKEAGLERLMLSGKPNTTTGCIFSLKQLGWKDTQSIEHTGAVDPVQEMTYEQRQAYIDALVKKRNGSNGS